ncbi:hypothetical protein CRE_28339 [Caenorhabditis remanei]|uniref:Uncharacterized protein n=1 Tax=Caenorhabditis remanei TaxID=31234 RepID=E3LNC1_CAERE|nr:hypothetical protein CRE_28339 [Caenorhabditis remanei]
MISIENHMHQQQSVGPTQMNLQGINSGEHPGMIGRGISNELPTAYVTSTPLPLAKAQQQQQLHQMQQQHQHQQQQQQHHNQPHHNPGGAPRMMSEEDKAENEKNAIISSLFEEIRLEATLFGGSNSSLDVKQEVSDDGDQPTELSETAPSSGVNKKLKKRKSELALEMTADDVDDILGESGSSNFNPKNPFGPSPSGLSNGFADLGSPGSSSFNSSSQKSSPPLSKYSQNNQGQRNSPPVQGFPNMSPYMTPQMNSPLHPQLQQQNSVTSSPPVAMHSPGQVPEFKPTIINGHVMNPLAGHPPLPHHHHLPHHTRFLQHQQSAPNLRLNTPEDAASQQQQQAQQHQQQAPQLFPYHIGPMTTMVINGQTVPFDRSLIEEFEMCVRSVLMASHRVYCRHVYRQLTAEVSELYARVAKNQVPKKAVKKIIAARQPATHGERMELERQFKCLSDGLESRQSAQLYESILNFLYKMRVAIPDASQ